MTTFLATERLRLRPFTAADGDALLALHSDPTVMRYLGPPETEVALPYYLGLYERCPGFGYWAAIEKATGAFLGWFLFRPSKVDPPPGMIELGYRLHTRRGAGVRDGGRDRAGRQGVRRARRAAGRGRHDGGQHRVAHRDGEGRPAVRPDVPLRRIGPARGRRAR